MTLTPDRKSRLLMLMIDLHKEAIALNFDADTILIDNSLSSMMLKVDEARSIIDEQWSEFRQALKPARRETTLEDLI